MSVQTQEEKAQTMGAIATVVSAFLVFVLAGGAVLASWVAAQEAATATPEPVESIEVPAEALVDALAEPEPIVQPIELVQPIEPPRQPLRPVRTTKRTVVQPAPVPEPEVPAEPLVESPPPAPVAPSLPVNPDGKGTVQIIGDAERVRLIGNRGPFTAGPVPSGTYTIQATFEGDDPRMAGTVVIQDKEFVRILCISEQRQCVRR